MQVTGRRARRMVKAATVAGGPVDWIVERKRKKRRKEQWWN